MDSQCVTICILYGVWAFIKIPERKLDLETLSGLCKLKRAARNIDGMKTA
jgi:hypothetical protein